MTIVCHGDMRHVRLAYKPYFFTQRIIFFSHNKLANSTFSHDLAKANRAMALSALLVYGWLAGWVDGERKNGDGFSLSTLASCFSSRFEQAR